ncbi:SH3 domain-containing protein [Uliginosibacterium sp. 31-16]|uniref:SH3 domain-containing protein n=1 Tax=Uliginosibacterium sp. 31-16 TaxID=3068315 RepID=UPI00273EB7E8|nr:SH3 domain-containing protein [Uliginosibacterium sp. 31-16]MDP5239777.1 SH3 domain-containing protein [Uliginosibacterium sp. 31-16]
MIRCFFLRVSVLIALAAPGLASALDYKSLADNAIVYDAGSTKAQPQFILLKGTPVEIIVIVDRWAKVREQSGGLGWVERGALSDTRQVIVTAASGADVRQRAEEAAPVVFSASKDVLLEVIEKPAGAWLKVKHRDGQTGYVPLKSVWGI